MQALGEKGMKVYTPLVPTVNIITDDVSQDETTAFDIAAPAEGWPQAEDDAVAVEEDVVALINQGRKVIIVCHSNGGFAGTQAAKPEHHYVTRAQQGLQGGVIGILYVSAILLPVGVAAGELVFEGDTPHFARLHKHAAAGLTTPVGMREFFFARVGEAETDYYSQFLRAQPVPRTKLTNDPYSILPLGYVVCEADTVLVPAVQEHMINAQVQKGSKIKLYKEPFDHCPTISAIDRLVEIVQDFARVAQEDPLNTPHP